MTDEELIQFLDENIEVTFNSGEKIKGHASSFEWGDDEDESCLSVDLDFNPNRLIGVSPSEVKSIKIIEK